MIQVEELFLPADATVLEALRKLDETGQRILFIAPEGKLEAALTDGDIRKFFLRGGTPDQAVSLAANYHPLSLPIAERGRAREVLQKMDACKTGALIRAAAAMGCILGGGTEDQRRSADEYASSLGLAFQIVDDILDVTGTEEQLGKPVHSDQEHDKSTYVALLGLEEAQREASRLTQRAVAALEIFGTEADSLRALAVRLADRKS